MYVCAYHLPRTIGINTVGFYNCLIKDVNRLYCRTCAQDGIYSWYRTAYRGVIHTILYRQYCTCTVLTAAYIQHTASASYSKMRVMYPYY